MSFLGGRFAAQFGCHRCPESGNVCSDYAVPQAESSIDHAPERHNLGDKAGSVLSNAVYGSPSTAAYPLLKSFRSRLIDSIFFSVIGQHAPLNA